MAPNEGKPRREAGPCVGAPLRRFRARGRAALATPALLAALACAAAAAADGAAPPQGLADSPLAMGLAGLADWSTQHPFIDLMKTARPWIGHLPGRWGGWGHAELLAGNHLDEHGWPTSLPAELESVETLLLTGQPEEAVSLAGRYRLTYAGEGTVEVRGGVRDVAYAEGEIRFDRRPGDGPVGVVIRATDPNGTGRHVRDVTIVKEEHRALHEAGALFNPDWIARVADMRALRFMDWMATNDSPVAAWDERPRTSDYTYALRGAPLEVMVALADEIGADPWFTLPHLATDDHIRSFAEYVRDHLDPRLKAHVEFSNEVWNLQFEQARWAERRGRARWGARAEDPGAQYYGMRAARMAAIWDEVFGAEAEARVVTVISTQTGWPGRERALLDAPDWVAEDPRRNRPPAERFDAYGVTGYFDAGLGTDGKAPVVLSWIRGSREAAEAEAEARGLEGAAREAHVAAHRYDRAVALAARELRDGSVTGDPEGSTTHLLGDLLPHHADAAAREDLDLVMYEGGTHVVGRGPWAEDAELTDFFIHLNYAPEMARLYETVLRGWREVGGTMFNAYVDVGGPSKWGSWGALRHLDDANPRWDALTAFNRGTEAWWEERDPAAFTHGVGLSGEGARTGTIKDDVLLGGPRDDRLVGHGGDDRLHGGGGDDVAVLPGRFGEHAFRTEGAALLAAGPAGVSRLREVETLVFAEEPDRRVAVSDLP